MVTRRPKKRLPKKTRELSASYSPNALATKAFVDLHQKIQDFILTYLKNFADPSNIDLDAPLPKQLNNVGVMAAIVEALRDEIQKPGWPVNAANFKLGGPELFGVMQGKTPKTLSYLVQFIYERARAAKRQ
jgi:hypothetical protein